MTILSRLGAFRNKAITHSIETPDGGMQEFKFYPPRMRMLVSGRMREIMDPLSQAVNALFVDRNTDSSRQQEVQADGAVTTYVQGVPPEVLELRAKQRSEAIKSALTALLADDTRYQVGLLLADSMRDDFSSNEGERAKESRAMMDEIDVPTLIELVKGYFKALAPVLDKSGNSIFSNLKNTVKTEVARALGQDEEGEASADQEAPSQSEGEPQSQPPSLTKLSTTS